MAAKYFEASPGGDHLVEPDHEIAGPDDRVLHIGLANGDSHVVSLGNGLKWYENGGVLQLDVHSRQDGFTTVTTVRRYGVWSFVEEIPLGKLYIEP